MNTSYILSWIEYFLIMVGLILIGVGICPDVLSSSNWAACLPAIMFIVGAGFCWKSITAKSVTFGCKADVAWIAGLVITICFGHPELFSLAGLICILAGLGVDFFRSYAVLRRADDCRG